MLMPSIFGEDLFDGFFDDFARPARNMIRYNTPVNTLMKTDIKETDGGYELDIDLPGYQKEDVKAQLRDGYLTISAQTGNDGNEKEEKDASGKYIRRERYYGSCSRSFYVGEDVTEEDIRAKFENGILKLFVPKKEAKPEVKENKYIAIEG
ncbi:MAG: Hsp20/alpha crystallin family protein [Lachnospiraceae bacterium]|nr:Hsp20/alpha crystallin family protein [Lachnospiraceae bacterium]